MVIQWVIDDKGEICTKDISYTEVDRIIKNLPIDISAIYAYPVDKSEAIEDVVRAKTYYLDFLYGHYSQLMGLDREKISIFNSSRVTLYHKFCNEEMLDRIFKTI